jgi:hypothetical protein
MENDEWRAEPTHAYQASPQSWPLCSNGGPAYTIPSPGENSPRRNRSRSFLAVLALAGGCGYRRAGAGDVSDRSPHTSRSVGGS